MLAVTIPISSDDIIPVDIIPVDFLRIQRGQSWNKYPDHGNYVLECFSGIVNYQDENRWCPIDISLRDDRSGRIVSSRIDYDDVGLHFDTAPYRLEIFRDRSGYRVYPDRNNENEWIDFYMPNIRPTAEISPIHPISSASFYDIPRSCSVHRDSISWDFTNFGVKVIPTNSMISFEYILKNRMAEHNIQMRIVPHNLRINEDGEIGEHRLVNLILDDTTYTQKTIPRCRYDEDTNILSIAVNPRDLSYPATIDPTLVLYGCNENDFYFVKQSTTSYNEAHDAPSSSPVINYVLYNTVGQSIYGTNFAIHRSYVYFDTQVPDNADITNANLSLYGFNDLSVTDFYVSIQFNETNVHPESPPSITDYNYTYYNNSNAGSFDTALGWSNTGYNDISLNESARENISRESDGGRTKYCVRSSHDINYQAISGIALVVYWNGRATTSKLPKLTLVYHAPEMTNPHPADGATGVSLQTGHSIQVSDVAGHTMNISWLWWNITLDDWEEFGYNGTVSNGIYRQNNSANYTEWSHTYKWRVSVECSAGVIANGTYTFTTINSTCPVMTNITPANRTMIIGSDTIVTMSVDVNDSEGQQFTVFLHFGVGNCSGFDLWRTGYNGTYSWDIPITIFSGQTIEFYFAVSDDNTVVSDDFWFCIKDVWSDHFCSFDNLINNTSCTCDCAPVQVKHSFATFKQMYNNSVIGGLADDNATLCTTMQDWRYGPSPRIVFTDNLTGYAIEMEKVEYDIMILKTVDSGASWSVIETFDCSAGVGVWYDQWTCGSYGTKIHIVYIKNVIPGTISYRSFDTASDTLSDFDDICDLGYYSASNGHPSITVSTNDDIFVSAFGGNPCYTLLGYHGIVYKTIGSGGSLEWINVTPTTGLFNDDDDTCQLIQLNKNNSILCVYFDYNAFDILYYIFNATDNSWTSPVVIGKSYSSECPFSLSYWKVTGEVYLAFQDNDKSASGKIQFLKYTQNNDTWWGAVSVSCPFGYDATLICSEGNGDLYIAFATGSSSIVMDVKSVNSTDGGATWSTPQKINNQPAGRYQYTSGNFMSMYRIYPCWFDESADDWFGTTVRNYEATTSRKCAANLTSVKMTIPMDGCWLNFNADSTAGVKFSIYNDDDSLLFSGLNGNNNDISTINESVAANRTIYLMMFFDDNGRVDSWNVSFMYLGTTVNIIIPYHSKTLIIDISASGSCNLDNVTLFYRYSNDNVTWTINQSFGIDIACPWEWKFNFTNDSGYYEFYSIGQGACGTEAPPAVADTSCYFNWGDFIQSVSNTIQAKWTTGTIISVVGGLCCVFSSLIFINRKNIKFRLRRY